LEKIAQVAATQWRRTHRTGDSLADRTTAQVAEGRSIAARRWKSLAATGSDADILAMSENFTRALVDACMGDWPELAGEADSKEAFSRRASQWIRHFAAISIMVSSITLVVIRPGGWPDHPLNAGVQTVILIVSGIACLSIDPTLGDRASAARKLVGTFSSKEG
jgi:hypothetical protein